ncbi:MAG: 5-oxoprolinase subunit PxpA [Flaviflexus sp.]|nr:5-oxoprolinase subunit PxpA [Flaviflexus sp.]
MATIDLNSDLGESLAGMPVGDDEAMLDIVSSANVAGGFHAGDPRGIAATCEAAARRGVSIGAHPSYRDAAGFGRRFIDYASAELADEVLYQIGAVEAMARKHGASIHYVKPHGALYNTIVHHEAHARAVVDAVRAFGDLALLLLPGSIAARLAEEAGIRVVFEAFADRAYTPEGTLVSRTENGAVLTDPEKVAARMVRLAHEGVIEAIDGTPIEVAAQSICVHGDSPGAVEMAREVKRGLEEAGVRIEAFA